jgi:prepilin-type N-terminal cleavage/methylation domain-containing protein
MQRKVNFGFTLIELLVVISIIGLLASIVLVGLSKAQQKARNVKRVGDIKQFVTALDVCVNSTNGKYPIWLSGNIFDFFTALNTTPKLCYNTATFSCSWSNACTGAGFQQLLVTPSAPLPADDPPGSTQCSTTYNKYDYISSPDGSSYTLSFCLGDQTGSLGPGYHYVNPQGMH